MSEEKKKRKKPWYKDGLRFECTQCGACCSGEPGFVWVADEEIAGMAGLLGSQQSALQGGGGLLGGLGQGLGNAFNVGINLDPTAPTQQGYTV